MSASGLTSSGPDRGRLFLTIALLVGLVVRLAILSQTGGLGTPIVDEQHYTQLAANLVAGNGYAWGPGQPTSIRPPLFPGLVSAVWTVTGSGHLQAIRALQVILALVTTWLVYRIGRAAFGIVPARYAAGAFFLYPSALFYNVTILTETLFTLLFVAFLLALVWLVRAPRVAAALAAGVVLGLAALTRSALWPLPLVLCPALLAIVPAPFVRRVVLSALVFAGFAVTVGPWAVRNTRLQHTFTVVDTMGGLNLRMGNYEYTPDDRMWDAVALTGDASWVHGIQDDFPDHTPTEGEKDKWAQRKAIAYIAAHPLTTLRRSLIKFADFWGLERAFIAGVQQGFYHPPLWFAALAAAAITAAYVLAVVLGVAGIWVARPDWRIHAVLLLPFLELLGAHMLAFGHSRYHFPLIPILALYGAAFATISAPARARVPRNAWMAAAACVLVLLAVWGRQVLIVDASRLGALLRHAG